MRIIEILRLREMGLSYQQIAKGAGVGRSTVGDVMRLCQQNNVTYERAKGMEDDSLERLLYPASHNRGSIKVEPDYEEIRTELMKGKGMNLRFIWEERYRKEHPDGLGYSQFCERYRRFAKACASNVTMHQEREPGKELFVDWMGDTLQCVADAQTGEMLTAHIFVATLGESGYPYAEASPDETQSSWLNAHVHAFAYYGGLPRIIVPDNCKTAVKSPKYYDPVINPAYKELAEHYGVGVLPARVRTPQDKAIVEEGVRWLETWLLGALRNQVFMSFAELNLAIRKRLEALVQRPFQKLDGSRKSVFDAVDKPALRPLPKAPFEVADMLQRRVPENYHVEYAGFYYSVPYTLFRQMVTVRSTGSMIEVFSKEHKQVAVHVRRYTGKRYVSNPEHMPPNHRAYNDALTYNGERYLAWAKQIGKNTEHLIRALFSSYKIEEQAYRSCMGILQFQKKYGNERLEAACKRALALGSPVYTTVCNILKHGLDTLEQPRSSPPTPLHENIRGADYYV